MAIFWEPAISCATISAAITTSAQLITMPLLGVKMQDVTMLPALQWTVMTLSDAPMMDATQTQAASTLITAPLIRNVIRLLVFVALLTPCTGGSYPEDKGCKEYLLSLTNVQLFDLALPTTNTPIIGRYCYIFDNRGKSGACDFYAKGRAETGGDGVIPRNTSQGTGCVFGGGEEWSLLHGHYQYSFSRRESVRPGCVPKITARMEELKSTRQFKMITVRVGKMI